MGADLGGWAEGAQTLADALTFHRLLQELGDLVRVLGVQRGGKDKLALRLHEVLPEPLPASGKGLTYQGLWGRMREMGHHRGNKEKKLRPREKQEADGSQVIMWLMEMSVKRGTILYFCQFSNVWRNRGWILKTASAFGWLQNVVQVAGQEENPPHTDIGKGRASRSTF